MLVDTDVLIWYLRGYAQAAHRLDQLPQLTLSAMSYLELLQGMRNKEELTAVQKMFALRQANVLPLTAAITQRATELMTTLTLSHGLQALTPSSPPRPWSINCPCSPAIPNTSHQSPDCRSRSLRCPQNEGRSWQIAYLPLAAIGCQRGCHAK